MSVKPWSGFVVECDQCGERVKWDGLDYAVFATEEDAMGAAGSDDYSLTEDGKHICLECAEAADPRETTT